ncbi:hypothetical protein MBLNU459_g4518t2 [Dothideomycetes sp. NU459]
MADHDDEDLFADLYDGDEAAPAPAPAPPAPTASAASEQPDTVQHSTESAPAAGPIANGSNGAPQQPADNQDQAYGSYDQDQSGQDMQGVQDYDYNQGNDYSNVQQTEQSQDDYKPIGIKEDG